MDYHLVSGHLVLMCNMPCHRNYPLVVKSATFLPSKTIYTNQDDDMGIEFGVGIGYKLMDNLMYNAHFSYLSTGDFFKEGVATASTEDVYLAAHALSMKF